ncbi:pilus assembly protein [Streptomyces sp. AJS327]|uniref:TadE/TadG family type IV pilus assembly protein n=1 Tax=Streptomyces sp. AJS327 TaxID=2545265 RepID=UPI0015DD67E0|nr:TadE family protein [Streptomyces sp. AJS327]MBA0051312.1 pilus assembly protein [Streptomyces sp. AJS327]
MTVPTAGRNAPGRPPARRGRGERGQVAIEYLGMIPLLILVAMAAIQLGLIAYAAQQAGTASRAAARIASQEDTPLGYQDAGREAMSDWLADNATITSEGGGPEEVTVRVEVEIPSVIPGVDDPFGPAVRTTTMPRD